MTASITCVAVFLGVLSRVMLPYLRKRKRESKENFPFKYGYVGTALVGAMITMLIYYKIPVPEVNNVRSGLQAFSSAFGAGFGWQSIVNEVSKWSEAFAK